MFTGIVEAVGVVKAVVRQNRAFSLEVQAPFGESLALGESVAVNGVCLTVAEIPPSAGGTFKADATPETFSRTTLGSLRVGSLVNLERALRLSGRLGGHIVTGHVDGTARLLELHRNENSVEVQLSMDATLGEYMVEKGSLAVDGISLTIASTRRTGETCGVSVSVIPHTWDNTALHTKRAGDLVNVECDIIGKYVRHFVGSQRDEPFDWQKYLS